MANQYTLTNDFAEIAEEKGTLYNKGDSAIELASTADTAKGAGILLLTGERRTFSGTLYARSMDAEGLLNVADFNDGGEGGEDDKTGGLPLGSVHPFLQTSIPDGWLSCENGQEVSRTAYPELWAWVQTNAPLITEAQWQTKAAAQKSVGYYSSGDGSTTFRLPRLIGFMEGVTAANVGAFTSAGLPNITGNSEFPAVYSATGAFSGSGTGLTWSTGGTGFSRAMAIDASRSSTIYGASNTVQPESVGMVWCVRAFGAAVNQGTVDITELAQMLNLKLSISDAPRVCTPFAFPSTTYITVPITGSGYVYTPAKNGWGMFYAEVPTASTGCVRLQTDYFYVTSSAYNTGGTTLGVSVAIPAFAGNPITWAYENVINFACRFFYAQGEV